MGCQISKSQKQQQKKQKYKVSIKDNSLDPKTLQKRRLSSEKVQNLKSDLKNLTEQFKEKRKESLNSKAETKAFSNTLKPPIQGQSTLLNIPRASHLELQDEDQQGNEEEIKKARTYEQLPYQNTEYKLSLNYFLQRKKIMDEEKKQHQLGVFGPVPKLRPIATSTLYKNRKHSH